MEIFIKREDMFCIRIICIIFSYVFVYWNKFRKKCNVLNKNKYYLLICIILGVNIIYFIIGKFICICICILLCIMLCKEMWWVVIC